MAIVKDRVARTAFGTNAKMRRGVGWGGKGSVHTSIPKRYRAAHRRCVEYPKKSYVPAHQGERECARRLRPTRDEREGWV